MWEGISIQGSELMDEGGWHHLWARTVPQVRLLVLNRQWTGQGQGSVPRRVGLAASSSRKMGGASSQSQDSAAGSWILGDSLELMMFPGSGNSIMLI